MAKSVKLTSGDYIDAAGVYDTNLGKTLSEINRDEVTNKLSHIVINIPSQTYTTFTVKIKLTGVADKSALFIFGSGNFVPICSLILSGPNENAPVRDFANEGLTASYDKETQTYTINNILKYGVYTIVSTAIILSITRS